MACNIWQVDLQTLANTRRPSQDFLAKLEAIEAKEKLDAELQVGACTHAPAGRSVYARICRPERGRF